MSKLQRMRSGYFDMKEKNDALVNEVAKQIAKVMLTKNAIIETMDALKIEMELRIKAEAECVKWMQKYEAERDKFQHGIDVGDIYD